MAGKATNRVIIALIERARERHDEAGLALRAAKTLAKLNKADHVMKAMMDFEGPTRDALDLFKSALTIKRELLTPDE